MGGMASYAASKHAAQAFSQCLRRELSVFGIQVTTINPSAHRTPMLTNAGDEFVKFWKTVPKEKQEQYGEGEFCQNLKLFAAQTIG
jgi:NAD(P)-dependent dehydrogenase (short-subunit alcohol dehydrogenase family)